MIVGAIGGAHWALKDILLWKSGEGLYPLTVAIVCLLGAVGSGAWFVFERSSYSQASESDPKNPALTWNDQITDWSVSIETLPLIHLLPEDKIAVFQQFRLVNVSKLHKRIIDLEIEIPIDKKDAPPLVFKTEYYQDSGYRTKLKERGKEKKSRGWAFLDSPIELPPSSMVEGQLDFILPESIIPIARDNLDSFRLGAATITIIDRVSGKRQILLLGEHFNALTETKFDPRHPDKYLEKKKQ